MIKTVGLEMHWLPKDIGSLFVKGGGMYGIEYWYEAALEKQKNEVGINSLKKLFGGRR